MQEVRIEFFLVLILRNQIYLFLPEKSNLFFKLITLISRFFISKKMVYDNLYDHKKNQKKLKKKQQHPLNKQQKNNNTYSYICKTKKKKKRCQLRRTWQRTCLLYQEWTVSQSNNKKHQIIRIFFNHDINMIYQIIRVSRGNCNCCFVIIKLI